jgi:hypothetical protein
MVSLPLNLMGGYNMKTYEVRFYGRTIGAIGILYWITDTVQAENEEAAKLKLYDKYEHISILTIREAH